MSICDPENLVLANIVKTIIKQTTGFKKRETWRKSKTRQCLEEYTIEDIKSGALWY